MKWHNICHAKNFSPNLGRPLKGAIPIGLYKKFYSLYNHYNTFEKSELNVYTSFLHNAIKEFKFYQIINSILEDLKIEIEYPQTFGLKLDEGGVLRLELYFYYNKRLNFTPEEVLKEYAIFLKILEKYGANIKLLQNLLDNIPLTPSTIWSYDLFDNDILFGDKINFYTENKIKDKDIIYWGNQFTKDINGKSKEGLFLCFYKGYDLNLSKDLNYNFNLNQLKSAELILKKYNCKEYNISNKKEANGETIFFVQYFGISDEEYEQFLLKNKYPSSILLNYQQNKQFYKSMSKEITEVYQIKDLDFCLKRSAVYGLI
jgi:hypothetical protein